MIISEHISLKEAIKSNTAKRKDIDNNPNKEQLENMQRVAEQCFEPLRRHHGKPIGVSSFFRSPKLNKAIGGSATSQHCAGKDRNGIGAAAIDIDADMYDNGITNEDIFYWLKENVIFDQLISEYPDKSGEPSWVHISKRAHNNRGQCLMAYKDNGKTKYIKI